MNRIVTGHEARKGSALREMKINTAIAIMLIVLERE